MWGFHTMMNTKINTNTTTNEEPKLSWEMVVAKFDNLIKFAAKQQSERSSLDSMICVEDLYQVGMIKLYDCWDKWCVGHNKDMEEFGAIFKKSLFRAVLNASKANSTASNVCIDLEDDSMENMCACAGSTEDIVEQMYLSEGIKHLREMLTCDTSRQLLDELANPSERTLYEVWADQKRKEMLKSQGKKVNVPKDNTVRMKHIMKSLGISTKQYDTAMSEIRAKASLAIDRF